MKPLLLFCFIVLLSCNDNDEPANGDVNETRDSLVRLPGATNPYATADVSPMDMIYFPIDYPKLKMTGQVQGEPYVRVIYSRPRKAGREIFGGLQKFGQPWRLGANESTEIELFRNATVVDQNVPAGRYILYCIPDSTSWTIVFNSNLYSWGLQQDFARDVARFKIPTQKAPAMFELFTMAFERTGTGADLIMAWDTSLARLPFKW